MKKPRKILIDRVGGELLITEIQPLGEHAQSHELVEFCEMITADIAKNLGVPIRFLRSPREGCNLGQCIGSGSTSEQRQ